MEGERGEAIRRTLIQVEHTDIGVGEHLIRFEQGLADELGPDHEDTALTAALREEFRAWQAEVAPTGA